MKPRFSNSAARLGLVALRLLLAAAAITALGLAVQSAAERRIRADEADALRIGVEDTARRVRESVRNLQGVNELNDASARAKARAFARLLERDPALLSDATALENTRRALEVDELHVTDGPIIVAGIPAAYHGYDMAAHSQSAAFLPAITNAAFELVQAPQPKGIDKEPFQYAGVARRDRPGIVQVGVSAARVEQARRLADVSAIAATARLGRGGRIRILPAALGPDAARLDQTGGQTLTQLCEGYRITVWMPRTGGYLSEDTPFSFLCIATGILLMALFLSLAPAATVQMSAAIGTLGVLFGRGLESGRGLHRGFLRRLLTHPVAFGCLAAFLLTAATAWFVQGHLTRQKSEALLTRVSDEVRKDVLESVNDMLFFIGNAICRHYRTPEAIQSRDVSEILARYDIDEINVINDKGRVCASSIGITGIDFWNRPRAKAFAEHILGAGEQTFAQPFRESVAERGVFRKYAGIAFPDARGFIQIGFSQERLKNDINYRFASSIADRRLGENGFFVCADNETGEIEACGHPAYQPGDTLAGIGFDNSRDGDTVFETRLYGERCLCTVRRYAYRTMLTALPLKDLRAGRNTGILATVAILLVVFAFVAVVMVRLSDLVGRLRGYIAAESERQHKDLAMARTIQTSALPVEMPETQDYRLFARMDTAREVGGDFYDFYSLRDGRIFFLIADVSGKGIPAAMFMMKAKAVIKACVFENADLPAAAALANDRLAENNDAAMFVTAWMGAYDRTTGRVEYVNAGHNPPLVKRADGSVEWVRGHRGLVFAAQAGIPYRAQEIFLAPGDSLLLYTDGVTEAVDKTHTLYGEARLEKALRTADELFVSRIRADVDQFADGAEQADDITMVALDVKRASAKPFPATCEGLAAATEHCSAELKRLNCPVADQRRLLIVLDEMGSNVVHYSGSETFTVALWRAGDVFTMELSDAGVPWNPLERDDPDITQSVEDRDIGGLGIFMTKKLMDSFEYRRTGGHNVVTLRRHV